MQPIGTAAEAERLLALPDGRLIAGDPLDRARRWNRQSLKAQR
jgi:hypothetical protein